jgi:fumarate reductase flavoprotein subunit
MFESKKVSRRNFIKDAAVLGAGATVVLGAGSIASAMPVPLPKKWDYTADVIIAGGGGGGLAAASILGQKGVSVILLEKEATTGGSSAICGGQIALAGTDMQKAKGIADSKELLIQDLMNVGKQVNNKSLVEAYGENQLEYYDWLKKIGAKFITISAGSGQSVPRGHIVNAGEHLRLLRKTALTAGAKIMDKTPAERLVFDEKSKRIVGIIGKNRKNKEITFKATKGVILATGGYSRDKDLLGLFTPPMKNSAAICGLGCTGDGMKMAWAYGAGLADVAYVKATFGFKPDPTSISELAYVYYKGATLVNQEGKRFVNESISYKLLGDAAGIQTGGYAYQIYDEPIRQIALKDVVGAGNPSEIEKSSKAIVKANSIAELAGMIGVKPEVLEQTIKEYNETVANGSDPAFGRKTLSGEFGKPVEIKTAPFYAFKSVAAILGTYAGVTINNKAQIIDIYGKVIPGLYAVGEITGGFHGAAYMTGTAFGKTQVFGMIAAKSIMNNK